MLRLIVDLLNWCQNMASWSVIGCKASLERGLLPDDNTLNQLISDEELFTLGCGVPDLKWPPEPLRETLIRGLSGLDIARFTKKYPGVRDALLMSLLQTIHAYYKALAGYAFDLRHLLQLKILPLPKVCTSQCSKYPYKNLGPTHLIDCVNIFTHFRNPVPVAVNQGLPLVSPERRTTAV